MKLDPGDVLKEARKAYKENDYRLSFEKYQWFFENSVKIKRSFYGVRLSYCLDEWAELGKKYLPAQKALVLLEGKSRIAFQNSESRESFHEYSSIAQYLGNEKEVFDCFLTLHKRKSEIAKNLFTFVYEYCAKNGKWDICREYLGNGHKKYEETLGTFDHLIRFSKEREGEVGESMRQEAVTYLKRDALWILTMLRFVNVDEEYNSAITRIETDLTERGFNDLYCEILASAPNK